MVWRKYHTPVLSLVGSIIGPRKGHFIQDLFQTLEGDQGRGR